MAMETIRWPKQTKSATRQVLALIQWTLAKTTNQSWITSSPLATKA
jgi:hypothetical protein